MIIIFGIMVIVVLFIGLFSSLKGSRDLDPEMLSSRLQLENRTAPDLLPTLKPDTPQYPKKP